MATPRTTDDGVPSVTRTREEVSRRVVGREHELELVVAAVAAGRDLVLEGPPGTSKTTILSAIADSWGIPLVFVEGNADLTPARLVGHHNPSRVLREDYGPDNFVDGPLVQAMRAGGFLYIEELNRVPEDTLNTLITAMAERRVTIPRVDVVVALPTFRIIASMNPMDDVGTTRLSSSVLDCLCRLSVGYQGVDSERAIVELRTESIRLSNFLVGQSLVQDAVLLTRATRSHSDVRQGCSVRGAIDLTLVADQLLSMRNVDGVNDDEYPRAMLHLSGRMIVDETSSLTAEQVLHEIWENHFVLRPAEAAPG